MDELIRNFLDANSGNMYSLKQQVNRCTDWKKLVRMWQNADRSTPLEDLIETRMTVVLPGILAQTTDWSIMVEMLKDADTASRPRLLIEERMAAVYESTVQTMTAGDVIPQWLLKLMEGYLADRQWPHYLDRDILVRQLANR